MNGCVIDYDVWYVGYHVVLHRYHVVLHRYRVMKLSRSINKN